MEGLALVSKEEGIRLAVIPGEVQVVMEPRWAIFRSDVVAAGSSEVVVCVRDDLLSGKIQSGDGGLVLLPLSLQALDGRLHGVQGHQLLVNGFECAGDGVGVVCGGHGGCGWLVNLVSGYQGVTTPTMGR